jgi:hypothetical protein
MRMEDFLIAEPIYDVDSIPAEQYIAVERFISNTDNLAAIESIEELALDCRRIIQQNFSVTDILANIGDSD